MRDITEQKLPAPSCSSLSLLYNGNHGNKIVISSDQKLSSFEIPRTLQAGRQAAWGTSVLIKASHLFLFRCQIVQWHLLNISQHINEAVFGWLNE